MNATEQAKTMVLPVALFSGKLIDLAHIKPSDVDIRDIAHALSNICRWSGHTNMFYSVSEHSVRVALQVAEITKHDEPRERVKLILEGLMHDAHEAYPPGDLAAPMKQYLRNFDDDDYPLIIDLQERVDSAIRNRFKLEKTVPYIVHRADLAILATEARDLMHTDWRPEGAEPLEQRYYQVLRPRFAELRFLQMFERLTKDRSIDELPTS